jgi:hypothetical protein
MILSAKRTGQVDIDTTLLQKISRLATLLKHKPEKKLAFSRTFCLPVQIGTSKGVLAKERWSLVQR